MRSPSRPCGGFVASVATVRLVLVVIVVVAACAGRVVAHGGAGGGVAVHSLLGAGAFLVGVAIAGVMVALDAREVVASARAAIGVYAGGALALGGLSIYVVV